MPNYYERLKVDPMASDQEIERALDQQFHCLRRLVTHHDPNVVSQATLMMQLYEKMRSILLDPQQRAAYNAALGIGDQLGGLIDPEATLKGAGLNTGPLYTPPPVPVSNGLVPPVPQTAPAPQPSLVRVDAWTCPKCKQPNTIGHTFCKHCGNKIGHACPKCEKMAELAAEFCPHCGTDKKKYFNDLCQAEADGLKTQVRALDHEINLLRRVGAALTASGLDAEQKAKFNELHAGHEIEEKSIVWGVVVVLGTPLICTWLTANFSNSSVLSFFVLILMFVLMGGAVWMYLNHQRSRAQSTAEERIKVLEILKEQLQQQIKQVLARTFPG